MAQLLEARMNRTYTALVERQELEPDTNLLKTYLIEAHAGAADLGAAFELADRVLGHSENGYLPRMEIIPSEEEGLLTVETQLEGEAVTVYADYSDPRFWVLHSMNTSNILDWLIHRLIRQGPEFDRVWMPADLLQSVTQLGPFRGLSLDYDRRKIPDVDFDAPDAPVEFLKMQLWGPRAGDVLNILRDERGFPHETTLAKVKVKYWLNGEDGEAFALDDIKYDGKITSRGTSFDSHATLTSEVYRAYKREIGKLEEVYAIHPTVSEDRLTLHGSPINLVLERPIRDLAVFCDRLFSAGEPFRLWGVPLKVADNYYSVRAVDLHVGCPLNFEIGPDFLRVYLPAGTCGNTVLRLYTNLQHHYDSLVRAVDGDREPIFEF